MFNKRNKVVLRVFGGLGNQLFCYAAARRLSVINKAILLIDDISGFKYDHLYERHFQLDHFNILSKKASYRYRFEPFSKLRRYVYRKFNSLLPFLSRSFIHQEFIEFDERLLSVKVDKLTYIEGYWQSEKYFKDIEDIIRKDLEIIPPKDKVNQEIKSQIDQSNSIALHVRYFDNSSTKESSNNMSKDYYNRAIQFIDSLYPDAHYFLFSDDPMSAMKVVPLSNDRVTCVSHNAGDANAYADLWLMASCKHFIIANSTFSWWGAWLSKNSKKCVITPNLSYSKNVVSWGFDGLIPDDWIKM